MQQNAFSAQERKIPNMIGFPRKSPRQKEWGALLKREERFLVRSQKEKSHVLNRRLEHIVPDKLRSALDLAFCKAFEIVFDKGTCVIEKTYKKKERENTYKVNAYAAGLKENRKTLGACSRDAGKNRRKDLTAAGISGVGLGVLGIGLPDIPLFTGILLRSIYETALSYGFGYDTPEEQCYILRLISTALTAGDKAAEENDELNCIGCHMDSWLQNPEEQRRQFIRLASGALSNELLYMKFLQGIPIAGVIGGVYDAVYLKKITDYADMKYKRRFLERI